MVRWSGLSPFPFMVARSGDGGGHGAFRLFHVSAVQALGPGAAEGIAKRLRDRLYNHLQELPCSFFDHRESGDLLQRCTSDVETLRLFLAVQVADIGRALIMLIIPIPLMLLINVPMTVASMVLVPPIVIFSAIFFFRVRAAFQKKDEAEGRLTARIQENLTGIRVVKAFHRQEFEEDRLASKNGEHRDLDFRLYRLFAWFWSTSDLLCMMQKTIVVVTGIVFLARGELALGAFFFFMSAVGLFIWPVRMMGRLLSELGKALVAVGRIREVLETPVESEPAKPVTPDLRGGIAFQNVGFSHDGRTPVLSGIDFQIEPGTVLAILGRSGSGKSTLVNLLPPLLRPGTRIDSARRERPYLDAPPVCAFENFRGDAGTIFIFPFPARQYFHRPARGRREGYCRGRIPRRDCMMPSRNSIAATKRSWESVG